MSNTKNVLAIQFTFDMATLAKTYFALTGEMISHEEIVKRFIACEPVQIDCSPTGESQKTTSMEIAAGYMTFIMAAEKAKG